MKTWTCGTCQAVNDVRQRVCDFCGAEPVRAVKADEPLPLPAYREVPARVYQRSAPSDRCTEPGCGKTVAEHQAELKAALTRMEVRRLTAVGILEPADSHHEHATPEAAFNAGKRLGKASAGAKRRP